MVQQMTFATRGTDAVKNRLRQYGQDTDARAKAQVRESADRVASTVQSLCPVDTGYMKAHMREEVASDGLGYRVGFWPEDFPAAFYPEFLEWGTRFMAAQPSVWPAAEAERPRFREGCVTAMRSR